MATLHATADQEAQNPFQRDLAGRRLAAWRGQPGFESAARFAQRLAADGINEDLLLGLLGESADALRARIATPPDWLLALGDAFERWAEPRPGGGAASPPDGPLIGALAIIDPLVRRGLERLRERVEALAARWPDPPFDPETVGDLAVPDLRQGLTRLLGRTVVLELRVAGVRGELSGSTPEERYSNFFERMSEPAVALRFLEEYPVLARQICVCIDHWVDATFEFLERLRDDWDAILKTVHAGGDFGVLIGLDVGSGDKHRRGRSVTVASFSSGQRLVYKPRSAAVDVHFQELLAWVNNRGAGPRFRTLAIIDRGSHSWVEFVEDESCSSPSQVSRFYQRQGGYLALLYVLCSTDFHYENLVAAGEHPVLVDLEALFHPKLEHLGGAAEAVLEASVLGVGLLPHRVLPDGKDKGVDLSGLGAVDGDLMPEETPVWERPGTDAMRLTRARVATVSGTRHRPMLGGTPARLTDHLDDVLAGFRSVYELMRKHREELLADGGMIARFARDEVRVIVRATHSYSVLLDASLHPDVLRDALERDCLFDRLWTATRALPLLGRLVGVERHDLDQGDVPLFTTRPCSRDLWTSAGERVPEILSEPGMEMVERRLRQMGPADLARQLWYIRASFASLAPDALAHDAASATGRPADPRPPRRSTSITGNADRLLASARAVGDRLEELACRRGGEVSWIGLSVSREGRWGPASLGAGLYDGLPGVALFLAALGTATREDRYTALAEQALAGMRRLLEPDRSPPTSVGAMSGWGGPVYVLAHLGALWRRDDLLTEAEAFVERRGPATERDDELDLFGGAAGCLLALLALHRAAPSARTLAAAVRCGERLLAAALTMDRGIGWVAPGGGPRPLSGLSHGAAGIALALHQLWALTGSERFRAAALEGLEYERSLFSAAAGNWVDLRVLPTAEPVPGNTRPRFVTAWCHGAPGIGLARLAMLADAEDPDMRSEVEAALAATVRRGFGRNHSLCHGDLGNLELLLAASLTPEGSHWAATLAQASAALLDGIERSGWRCANPPAIQSPELMTGLAGIGYGLLRLAMPASIPSVLVLAPPRETTG
jgi:type 2 lantibiotic biosynthesis protein LanM